MVEDVQRPVEVDQGVERQPGGVLQSVLVADPDGQCGIGAGLPAQVGQLLQQLAMAGLEGGDAGAVLGIQHAAVG
ncbi:hypothetical protein D9M68_708110 [compost metagenome]